MIKRIAVVLFVSFAATAAGAADAVIAKASGWVYYRTASTDTYVRAKGGEELSYGDRVRTGGAASLAQITLGDRGAVLLRGDSSLTLEGSADQTTLRFRFGEYLIGLRKALTTGQRFRVKTPAAVAAVRGTLFWGKSDKDDKSSTYAGFGHTVEITAQGQTVTLGPGQKVTIPFGQAPSEAAPSGIGIDYAKNFAIDGSLQNLESLSELPAAAPAPAAAPKKGP